MQDHAEIRAQGGGYGPPGGGYGPPAGGYPPPGAPGGYAPPGAPGGYAPPPGMPAGPPGGMPPAAGGGGGPADVQAYVNKWFTLSIVSIFCGCGLLGIINVVIANGAKQALAAGDSATALQKIKTARMLCIVGYVLVGLNILLGVLYAVLLAVGVINRGAL
jgi:hypothetical protein